MINTTYDHANELRNDIHVVSTNWYVNRCPLVSRLSRVPIGTTTFTAFSDTRAIPERAYQQFCQTFTHPVIVGGYLIPESLLERQNGGRFPFEHNKMVALQNLMDDMETTCYYGKGKAPWTGRPNQKGLCELLATNRIPTERIYACGPAQFIKDAKERCQDGGGDPDALIVSGPFALLLASLNVSLYRIDAGSSVFGTPIDIYGSEIATGMSIIVAPLLRSQTAILLTSCEVRLRMKRNEFWNPRGSRGDAIEGDWIAEGAIEVENERHHAWVE